MACCGGENGRRLFNGPLHSRIAYTNARHARGRLAGNREANRSRRVANAKQLPTSEMA
jgi:hypothetical protein